MMTARELIEHLSQFDGDMPVVIEDAEGEAHEVYDNIQVETVTDEARDCEEAVVIRW
jgi:hypothetical protein